MTKRFWGFADDEDLLDDGSESHRPDWLQP